MSIKNYIKKCIHVFFPLDKIKGVSIFTDSSVTKNLVKQKEVYSMSQVDDIFGNRYINCKDYEIDVPEFYTFTIKNGKCIIGNEEVYNYKGDVFWEINTLKENYQIGKFKSKFKKKKVLKGNICYLDTKLGSNVNYCHFVLEVLPRLHLINESKIKPDFYILPLNQEFHQEFYSLCGISPDKVVKFEENAIIEAENLITTTLLNNWDYVDYRDLRTTKKLWLPSWIKTFYKDLYSNISKYDNSSINKLTYISRKKAKFRRLANEDEIIDLVKESGFNVYYLEDLTVSEKAKLFYSSKMIIALHGAGLANLVFCNKENTILEINSKDYIDVTFKMLANTFDIDYHFMVGDPILKEGLDVNTEDIYVNPQQLEIALQKLLFRNNIS